MAEREIGATPELSVDRDNLYREEVFTDLRMATIRRLTPVLPDGTPDRGRQPLFYAQTQVMTQLGPVPVHANIEARSLTEAIERTPDALAVAIQQLVEEVQEARRREASRIVHPAELGRPGGGIIK